MKQTDCAGCVPAGVERINTPIHIIFRKLKSNEIDCRIQSFNEHGNKKTARLLLYKDARVDMYILDETVGNLKWQRQHQEIKGVLYCGVGIRQNDAWVWKWDCGTESNAEKEKGEASDAFKRACYNWGIGRELYSAPVISVELKDSDFFNGKLCQSFSVKDIDYSSSNEITYLNIVDKWGNERFVWGKKRKEMTSTQREKALKRLANGENIWEKLRDTFAFDEESLRRDVEAIMRRAS